MGYEKLPRTRKGFVVEKAMYIETPDVKKASSVEKELEIVNTVLDRDDQLNLMALIIEQIGDLAGLDTPEFAYAKVEFAKIKSILNSKA